jgi:hypothetical protein
VVSEHPALSLARTAHLAADELQTYVRPGEDFPRRLTPDEHIAVLEQIRDTLSLLGRCVGSIAMAQESGRGTRIPLVKAASGLGKARDLVAQGAIAVAGSGGGAPAVLNQAAKLAGTSFPKPVSGDAAQAAHPSLGGFPAVQATPHRAGPPSGTPRLTP